MKYTLLLLIGFSILVEGCKKKQTEIDPDETNIPGIPPVDSKPEFDTDFISLKDPEKVYHTTIHKTKFETVPEIDSSLIGWTVLAEDGHKIEGSWVLPSDLEYVDKYAMQWDQILQKWRHNFYIEIKVEKPLALLDVKLNIKNNTLNKTFSRSQKLSVVVQEKEYDISMLNFGMGKSEAKENEIGRSVGSGANWVELSPSLVMYGEPTYFPEARTRQYDFTEGRLTKVSEFRFPYSETDVHSPEPETWNAMIKHLGGTEFPQYSKDEKTGVYSLPEDFSWTSKGLKFTIGERYFKGNDREVNTLALVIEKQ